MDYSLQEKNKILLIVLVPIIIVSAIVAIVIVFIANRPELGTEELSLETSLENQIEEKLEITPEFEKQIFPQQQEQPKPEPQPEPLPAEAPSGAEEGEPKKTEKSPCEGVICPDNYFCVEIDDKCVAQPATTSYCGDNICQDSENRESCLPDCIYEPMQGEGIISQSNGIVIYSEELAGEWQILKLKDSLNCVSIIREKFKIDLPEPAKNKLMILNLLVEDDEKAYSYVNSFGIVHVQHIDSHESVMENIDYFREQINEKQACLGFHEVLHIFLLTAPIPLWASEGLATYSDLEFNPSRLDIQCKQSSWYGTDSQGGTLERPYSDLSKPAGQDEEPGIYWYYTSHCFWKYIKAQYGDSAIIAILQELKRNQGNNSLDFLKDIVNKVLKQDITNITKPRFNIP